MTNENVAGDTELASEESAKKTGSKEATVKSLSLRTFYGLKAGMTRIFDEHGNSVPVTVVKLIPNYVSQVKTDKKDKYNSYQLAFYEKREKLLPRPLKGHVKKAGISTYPVKFSEVRTEEVDESMLGTQVKLGEFTPGTYVDVTGVSKGKGFQGVIKRYGFSGGPGAHGSKFHRAPGSIGMHTTPAKVLKGKKLPGHMGSVSRTVQNLKVVEVNEEGGYLLIKGSVPGAKNGQLRISRAIKK